MVSGAMDAAEALCHILAPLVGGLLLEHVAAEAAPALCSLLGLAGAAAIYAVAPDELKAQLWVALARAANAKKED